MTEFLQWKNDSFPETILTLHNEDKGNTFQTSPEPTTRETTTRCIVLALPVELDKPNSPLRLALNVLVPRGGAKSSA